jgi:hypothetical protein
VYNLTKKGEIDMFGFDYYYGSEAEQFRFLRLPYVLFTDREHFGKLSYGAKILYAMLLERMNLSRENKWFDDENRVYIIFTIDEISEKMNCSNPTAIKMLQELDDESGVGLISKKRQGAGHPTIIYVKKFIADDINKSSVSAVESETAVKDFNARSKESLPEKSKSLTCEVKDFNPNYIDNNYTENIYTDNQSISQSRTQENFGSIDRIDREEIENSVKEQIEYECLASNSDEAVVDMVNEIKDLIVDVLCGERCVVIDGRRVSDEAAKSAYRKLTFEHIMYVLHGILNYPEKISRIDRFLTVSLYNAVFTYTNSTFSGFEHNIGKML